MSVCSEYRDCLSEDVAHSFNSLIISRSRTNRGPSIGRVWSLYSATGYLKLVSSFRQNPFAGCYIYRVLTNVLYAALLVRKAF